ncbi:MAG: selenium cofactor biosynthesis protein YqeC [Clostridia bacterium]|nr:selenium cofactor biosynthesis protein YqeC [Clostridia bacterium]
MIFSEGLRLSRGERVAVVGCGGKTSLISCLAKENAGEKVLVAPTARMALREISRRPGVTYLGHPSGEKLLAAPLEDIREEAGAFHLTLMEADGSDGLPLKGWAPHEPVVPPFTTLTVGVVSVKAVGLPVTGANVHRLALFLEQVGLETGGPVTEADVAKMIRKCLTGHGVGRQAVYINQADTAEECLKARCVAEHLRGFRGLILLGSLKEGKLWPAA